MLVRLYKGWTLDKAPALNNIIASGLVFFLYLDVSDGKHLNIQIVPKEPKITHCC